MFERGSTWTIIAATSAAVAAVGLMWLFSQTERYLQLAAGLFLIVLIAAVVLLDRFWAGRREISIKDFILSSYAIFLGLGMLAGVFRPDWRFDVAAIALSYGGLLCFLFGFSLSGSKAVTAPSSRRSFVTHNDQLFTLAVLFFALGFAFLVLEWCLYGQLQSYSNSSAAGMRAAALPKPYINTFTE
ncbi:MAG: hypothetical protein ACRD1N_01870, partial [Terriglobia bacterium]